MSTPPDLRCDASTTPSAEARPSRGLWRGPGRPDWVTPGLLTFTRWVSIIGWLVAFLGTCYLDGIPYFRTDLLVWMAIGLGAASIGKRAIWTVVLDFLPFALVLIAYDYLRGFADTLGMPTWWHPQNDVDKIIFGGVQPTVWLQEHLKYPTVRWWDIVVGLTYVSFFFLPYLTAGVLWLRSRAEFRRWAGRFVCLSFLGFGLFALIPAAPPWAAARCSAAAVSEHPSTPRCMRFHPSFVRDGGLLGPVTQPRLGAQPYIERISTRGFSELHLKFAGAAIKTGQGGVDLVAAVPSLHAGGTMLFVIFFWRRSRVWFRAILAAYAVLMGFALVYSAEHYLSDILAGWLRAFAVAAAFAYVEHRRKGAAPVDTLDEPPRRPAPTSPMENPCPPTATTPLST